MNYRYLLTWTILLLGVPLAKADEPKPVIVLNLGDQIEFRIGQELVSRYHKGASVAKPYLYPVYAPGGIALTRDYPMEPAPPGGSNDHIHQKSLWFCHGDVIPEGMELKSRVKGVEGVDFWAESKGHGVIVCTRVEEPRLDKGHGQVTTHNEWRTAEGEKVLDEVRTIHLYDLGSARLFVFDIDMHASVVPITFGDTKEGAFGVRIRDELREDLGRNKKGTGELENAEGKVGERAVWGMLSPWCDYSGPLDGKTIGLTIFDDPANPYPAYWHSRGYGLMAANPFGRAKSGFPAAKGKSDLVKLPKGEHLKLRYGVLLHLGDAPEGKVAEHYAQFVKLGTGK